MTKWKGVAITRRERRERALAGAGDGAPAQSKNADTHWGLMTRAATVMIAVWACLAPTPLFAQTKAKAQNVPEIPYESVPGFLKLPANLYLGEGIGVATNSKGHVFVYTRSGDT